MRVAHGQNDFLVNGLDTQHLLFIIGVCMELVCKLDTAFHSPLGDVAAFGVVIVRMLAHYAVCGRQWVLLERGRSEMDLETIASTDPMLCPGLIYIP